MTPASRARARAGLTLAADRARRGLLAAVACCSCARRCPTSITVFLWSFLTARPLQNVRSTPRARQSAQEAHRVHPRARERGQLRCVFHRHLSPGIVPAQLPASARRGEAPSSTLGAVATSHGGAGSVRFWGACELAACAVLLRCALCASAGSREGAQSPSLSKTRLWCCVCICVWPRGVSPPCLSGGTSLLGCLVGKARPLPH